MPSKSETLQYYPIDERLKSVFGEKFITTPDQCVTEDTVLHPGINPVKVTIDFGENFPTQRLAHDFVYVLGKAVRSRYAQLGVDVGTYLYEPPQISSGWNNLQNGKTLEIMVPVRNLSTRDIALSRGVGLFRYYSPLAAKFLKGKDLLDQLNASIKIEGKEKEDWTWVYVPNSKEQIDNIIGIKMRLGSERHWIPPDNSIINLEAEGLHHGREAVAKLRKPIPPNSLKSLLWTGETTAKLVLDKSINALISPWVVGHPQHDEDNPLMIGEQIMSLIIDGERTDHPVIAEVYSPTAPQLMPNWIELYFWQDKI